ncbi:hypothetical protein ACFC0D_27910, partial [Streptomyces sp. NPDC056222]|uniref:hypothetical protein n=1 Tax=Streptomyces sp. NPDC056222 TaxID=3345749 RepID=UPI0035D58A46
ADKARAPFSVASGGVRRIGAGQDAATGARRPQPLGDGRPAGRAGPWGTRRKVPCRGRRRT